MSCKKNVDISSKNVRWAAPSNPNLNIQTITAYIVVSKDMVSGHYPEFDRGNAQHMDTVVSIAPVNITLARCVAVEIRHQTVQQVKNMKTLCSIPYAPLLQYTALATSAPSHYRSPPVQQHL